MRLFVKIASGLWVGLSTSGNWFRGLLSGLVVGIACLIALSFVDFDYVLDVFIPKEHRQLQKQAYEAEQEQTELSKTYYQRHPEEDPNYIRRDSPLNQMLNGQTRKQDGEEDNSKLSPGNNPVPPVDGSK